MEFRQLEYFIAVADELNFGKAALLLHVSQPAVSKQIKLLEEDLGVALFDQEQKIKHKRVVLTEEGSYFYTEAQRILALRDASMAGLQRLKERKKTVKLGLWKGLPQSITAQLIKKLSYPDIDLKVITYDNLAKVQEGIDKGDVLLGTVLSNKKRVDGIECFRGIWQVSVACNHPLLQQDFIRPVQLKNQKIIGSLGQELGLISSSFSAYATFEMEQAMVESKQGVQLIPSFFPSKLPNIPLKITENVPSYLYLAFKKNSFIVSRLR